MSIIIVQAFGSREPDQAILRVSVLWGSNGFKKLRPKPV
jgi:hypothetical protein